MKKKILFFIESLGGGGAEKVLSTIVKHLDTQKFDVTVCVIMAGGEFDEEVERRVRLCSLLNSSEEYHGFGKILYWLKYHLIYDWLPYRLVYDLFIPKGNDVEIAFVEGFSTKLLSCSTNSNAKKIAWVHCDLKNQPWPIQEGIYRNKEEEKACYGKYDTVVCVSGMVEDVMRGYYDLSNTVTIYNPIDVAEINRLAGKDYEWNVDSSKYNIISVGRLEKVKGYDKLIPVLRNIRKKGVDAHLWLVGEGSEMDALVRLVAEEGLGNNVTFTGFLRNPYSLMSKMNLFICSSRAEGFSLVIAEAMVLGIPVMSMNCAGPKELMELCECGILCDSYEELELHILEKKAHICEKNKMSVFDASKVICQIEDVLNAG